MLYDGKLLTAVTSRFATMVYHVIDSKLQPFKTTAIIQNHVTIVRPCDRSNLNASDSGAELAE